MITKDSLMARINSMIKDIDIGLKLISDVDTKSELNIIKTSCNGLLDNIYYPGWIQWSGLERQYDSLADIEKTIFGLETKIDILKENNDSSVTR